MMHLSSTSAKSRMTLKALKIRLKFLLSVPNSSPLNNKTSFSNPLSSEIFVSVNKESNVIESELTAGSFPATKSFPQYLTNAIFENALTAALSAIALPHLLDITLFMAIIHR